MVSLSIHLSFNPALLHQAEQLRTKYYYAPCPPLASREARPLSPEAHETDFLINASVQSTIRLEGRFREPFEDNQGKVGEQVPIVAALMQRTGTLPGVLDVTAKIEKPGSGEDIIQLYDDGSHGDGGAGDGIYGRTYPMVTVGGAYNVTIRAVFEDPSKLGRILTRLWLGGFYAEGPGPDPDDDDLPPWWEKPYECLDPQEYNDPLGDWDQDGASHATEYENGTHPCDPDSDDGGETDGSEILSGRDPHDPEDDVVPQIHHFSVRPLNGAIVVRWSRPQSYTHMYLGVISTTQQSMGGLGPEADVIDMGQSGVFTQPLQNGVKYGVQLWGAAVGGAGPRQGAPTQPVNVTPKPDPDAPSGFILINNGAPSTASRAVMLRVNATDVPLAGLPAPGSAATVAHAWSHLNEVSDGIQMRFTDNPERGWTPWQPLAPSRPWRLACGPGSRCLVYAQFRDGALNKSLIVFDDIALTGVHLPLVLRNF